MTRSPLPDDFSDRGEWLVQAIDPRARLARLVRMDQAAFRDASFLDDRMLGSAIDSRLCSLDSLVAAAAPLPETGACWIFHIGHVGSTLVSRLLGEVGGVLAVREPRSLRDLGVAGPEEQAALAETLRKLLGRGLTAEQRVVIKATSFVSEFAPLLVARDSRALFLYASPRSYIEGILAGENSVTEIRTMAAERARRLQHRGIELAGFGDSDAHLAAAAWLCEMTALEAAADRLAEGQVAWADFDAMLAAMPSALAGVARHFGITVTGERLAAIASGPLMHRYSKAPEFDYSPALRADLLAGAGRRHHDAIEAALAALARAAEQFPLARRALERTAGES